MRPEDRFAVWLTHDRKCFWCDEIVDFRSTTIDHVIPKAAVSRLPELINMFGLPADFSIESFENWVPAHVLCNSRKNADVMRSVPATLSSLDRVRKKAGEARAKAAKIINDASVSKALMNLEIALTRGHIDFQEAIDLAKQLQIEALGWHVLDTRNGVQIVTNGLTIATRPDEDNSDISWLCGNCRERGPWRGSICAACGSRSGIN